MVVKVQPPAASRRDRARLATVAEIKATALQLMRSSGTTDVRFSDIARAMGMTPPALYRYFDDRDELLTALIADGYRALAADVAAALDGLPPTATAARWVAVASAYRSWALREPQQFALILGMPVPGYVAPDEGPTTEAAKAAMAQLESIFLTAAACGRLRRPLIREVPAVVCGCAMADELGVGDVLSPESFQAMLATWAVLHGFVALEAFGHLQFLGAEARDALFHSHVRLAAKAAGLPVPTP